MSACIFRPAGRPAELIAVSYEDGITSLDPATGKRYWDVVARIVELEVSEHCPAALSRRVCRQAPPLARLLKAMAPGPPG
jgi:hypothetical protein